jgi:hypothetical protein
MLVLPATPVAPAAGAPYTALALPPELVPALAEVPALPPAELSSESLPLQAARAVAEAKVAPNANVAARPRRVLGKIGSGEPARSSGCAQNGHSASETRT